MVSFIALFILTLGVNQAFAVDLNISPSDVVDAAKQSVEDAVKDKINEVVSDAVDAVKDKIEESTKKEKDKDD
jgi:hypothetical protein